MIKKIIKVTILLFLLFALPVIGILSAGKPLNNYIEFPPSAHYVQHAPFSMTAFVIISLIVILFFLPVIIVFKKNIKYFSFKSFSFISIPKWGIASLILLLICWVIAWSNLDFLSKYKIHTFFPLWLSYILSVNALQFKISGKSIMTDNPQKFLLLFPVSMIFWWYFEFLNGFVHNWMYIGPEYGPLAFLILSSIAFSTVLPAVASTSLLICTLIKKIFQGIKPVKHTTPVVSGLILVISCTGLFLIGLYPDYLFPFIWVSPFLIIISVQSLLKKEHILSGLTKGDWSVIVSSILAGLVCGFFWEMWNFYSLSKWQYLIPLVNKFHIFEMPLLGYAGYIPFGMLCVEVSKMSGISVEAD